MVFVPISGDVFLFIFGISVGMCWMRVFVPISGDVFLLDLSYVYEALNASFRPHQWGCFFMKPLEAFRLFSCQFSSPSVGMFFYDAPRGVSTIYLLVFVPISGDVFLSIAQIGQLTNEFLFSSPSVGMFFYKDV